MADDPLERLERLCANSSRDLRGFLRRNRFALSERWVLDRLEQAPQPLSFDSVYSVMIEALHRPTPQPQRKTAARTLGSVLYSCQTGAVAPEEDWVALVSSVAAGRVSALRKLYARTQRIVHKLVMQTRKGRDTADDITRHVFQEVWSQASTYDPAHGTVVSWIMNHARSKTLASPHVASPHIAGEDHSLVNLPAPQPWVEPKWDEVTPGLLYKLLATDAVRNRVSMLVRLMPGAEYPPHRHAGVEELHLLDGELWIDDRKVYPGDYNRAEPGTSDKRVWSETGCACVLITSTRDELH